MFVKSMVCYAEFKTNWLAEKALVKPEPQCHNESLSRGVLFIWSFCLLRTKTSRKLLLLSSAVAPCMC